MADAPEDKPHQPYPQSKRQTPPGDAARQERVDFQHGLLLCLHDDHEPGVAYLRERSQRQLV